MTLPGTITENNLILPPNYVMVKPDVDIRCDRNGLVRNDFVDAHLGKAVTGTVVAVCKNAFFLKNEDDADQDLVQESLEYDVDVEVRPGDRVLFRYMATIDADQQFDGHYIMRYDALFCRIETGWLHPLNGMIFLSVDADQRKVGCMMANPSYIGAAQTIGKVVHEGMPVRRYRDYDDVDFDGSLVGKTVIYSKNRAIRIEADDFAQFTNGEYSLYRLHRRHVRGILEDVQAD